jgi:hypothetical protein
MIDAKQAIEIDRAKLKLVSVWELESRSTSNLLVLVWLCGQELEEGVVHAENRSCDEPAWESPKWKDSQPLSFAHPRGQTRTYQ